MYEAPKRGRSGHIRVTRNMIGRPTDLIESIESEARTA
jgi:hypothetical protein